MNRLAFVLGLALLAAGCCPTPPRIHTPIVVPPPTPRPDVTAVTVVETPPPPPSPLDWSRAEIDFAAPPAALPDVTFAPPSPTRFTLKNGVDVLLVENHRLPLVSVRVAIRGAGSRADGPSIGLAAFTADLLDEGAGARSALELPEELERLGADLAVGAGGDYVQVSVDTMAETLAPALAIAADVLLRPRLETADFDRIKAERIADLGLRSDQPRTIVGLVFDRVVFGAHPYAEPGDGYAKTVGAITLANVKAFWRSHYGPSATSIVIVGDVTEAQARAQLQSAFGAWKTKVKLAKAPAAPKATTPIVAFVDRPGAPQSVVTIGRLGPATSDRNRAANDIINTAIGGSFASRLNTTLRETKGYTYGISSTFWRGQWAGTWRATSSIRTDVTVLAIQDALAIIDGAGHEPLPDDELAKAKSFVIRGLPQDFETNAAIAGAFTAVAVDGRPLTYFRDLPNALSAVTAAAAQQQASDNWRGLTIVVVGDWAVIGDDLKKLGLPIKHYTTDGEPAL
jgi:zinc protease